jgi:hypothetical protein
MLWFENVMQAQPNVIYVQQAAGGMEEWVKILISAATGAVFGILGNVAMEFAKPYISKSVSKRTVTVQIGAELVENMDSIEGAERLVADAADQPEARKRNTILIAVLLLKGLKSDRFDYYFENQKETVYEIQGAKKLISLYSITSTLMPQLLERNESQDMSKMIGIVAATAREYMLLHNLKFAAGKSSMGDLLKGI